MKHCSALKAIPIVILIFLLATPHGMAADVSLGDSKAKVLSILGATTGTFRSGNKEILMFASGTVTLQKGVVVEIEMDADKTVKKTAAPAPATNTVPVSATRETVAPTPLDTEPAPGTELAQSAEMLAVPTPVSTPAPAGKAVTASLPPFDKELTGYRKVRISNDWDSAVTVGFRSIDFVEVNNGLSVTPVKSGKDIRVAGKGQADAYLPDKAYLLVYITADSNPGVRYGPLSCLGPVFRIIKEGYNGYPIALTAGKYWCLKVRNKRKEVTDSFSGDKGMLFLLANDRLMVANIEVDFGDPEPAVVTVPLPPVPGNAAGKNEVVVYNSDDAPALVAFRSKNAGADIVIPANDKGSVFLPAGNFETYVMAAGHPEQAQKSDPVNLSGSYRVEMSVTKFRSVYKLLWGAVEGKFDLKTAGY